MSLSRQGGGGRDYPWAVGAATSKNVTLCGEVGGGAQRGKGKSQYTASATGWNRIMANRVLSE